MAVDRYLADKAAIERRYEVPYSPVRHARLRKFYDDWRRRLSEADFGALNREGQTDYVLLRNRVDYDEAQLDLADRRWKEIAPLVPFADALRRLQEDRHDRKRAEGRATATSLSQISAEIAKLTQALLADAKPAGATPVIATRAIAHVGALRAVLADWYAFYDGYDPVFSWWTAEPFGRLDKALAAYSEAMGRQLVGLRPGQPAPIVGDPVLAEGLKADLAYEMLPYSAEELIAIGEREFAWIEGEFKKVSRDMGFGDDWKQALEHTKNLAPPPGDKPWIIFDIAKYSEEFVSEMNAITMAPLAREVWRLAMQTPERQLINPFFVRPIIDPRGSEPRSPARLGQSADRSRPAPVVVRRGCR